MSLRKKDDWDEALEQAVARGRGSWQPRKPDLPVWPSLSDYSTTVELTKKDLGLARKVVDNKK